MWLTKQNMDEFSVPWYKFVGMSEITNIVEKLECMLINLTSSQKEKICLGMEAQFIELNYKPSNILIGVI